MSIKGKTDGRQPARLPIIARVYAGSPKEANRPGKNLNTHFRVQFEEGFKHLEPLFVQLYGSLTPTSLPGVVFPTSDPDQALDAWWQEYAASGIIRRCDGGTVVLEYKGVETIERVKGVKKQEMVYDQTPHPCLRAIGGQCGCTMSGSLRFWLLDFLKESGVLGLFAYRTGSSNILSDIASTLHLTSNLLGGLSVSAPFRLERYQTQITKPINGERRQTDEWLVRLVPEFDQVAALLEANLKHAAPSLGGASLSLPDGHIEDAPITIEILGVTVRARDNGTPYLALDTAQGDIDVPSRKPFIDAGVIDEGEWKRVGFTAKFGSDAPLMGVFTPDGTLLSVSVG